MSYEEEEDYGYDEYGYEEVQEITEGSYKDIERIGIGGLKTEREYRAIVSIIQSYNINEGQEKMAIEYTNNLDNISTFNYNLIAAVAVFYVILV